MLSTISILLWSVLFGFVTAGIVANCYHWLMARPMSFHLLFEGGAMGSLMALPLLAVTGPAVIARNAWRGRRIEGRAWAWIAVSGVLIAAWSFIIGLYILDMLLKLELAFLP